jgi:hypothetical protein
MSLISLEQQLDLLERKFNEVSSALVDGNPEIVQSTCAGLQQLAVDFVQIAEDVGRTQLSSSALALRIQALSQGLPALRAALSRRTIYVEQALQLVVPATQKSTYAKSEGRFGAGFRQSGQLKVLSA